MDRRIVASELLKIAKELTSSRLVVPHFSEGRPEKRLRKVIPLIEQALQDKHIWNVDFKDIKDNINRGYYESHNIINDKYRSTKPKPDFTREEFESWTPEQRKEYYSIWTPDNAVPFEIRGLNKFLRGLKKYNGHMRREYEKWAKEWLPYLDVVKELKPYVEKGRKPNPNAPVKERYVAPPTSSGGMSLIRGALQKVVSGQAGKLEKVFEDSYMKYAETFLEKRDETQTPYEYFKNDIEGVHITQRLVENVTRSLGRNIPKNYELRSDASSIAKKLAETTVKDIIERYLAKNTNKIGSVAERKGGLEKIGVKHGSLRGWGFEGELSCYFADGTQFTVRNKAVYHYNYRGSDYIQFPTTFHQVVWPDGKKSSMLSEKQMNEDWAKA